jgi:hypothetical protein
MSKWDKLPMTKSVEYTTILGGHFVRALAQEMQSMTLGRVIFRHPSSNQGSIID